MALPSITINDVIFFSVLISQKCSLKELIEKKLSEHTHKNELQLRSEASMTFSLLHEIGAYRIFFS